MQNVRARKCAVEEFVKVMRSLSLFFAKQKGGGTTEGGGWYNRYEKKIYRKLNLLNSFSFLYIAQLSSQNQQTNIFLTNQKC